MRAKLDPSQLAARGIGIDEVATAIQSQNSNLPVGTLYGVHQSLTVQANGQLFDAAAYRTMIVAYRNGSPVALGDLGKVVDGVENDRIGNWYDDRQVVTLAIQRQPGSNTIAVVDAIKAKLPALRAQLPGALKLDVLFDRSVPIRESVHDVEFTLVLTIALVVLVIFLFLRNVRATLIPSLAVPASIVGTFAAMSLLNFSLDNLSLMALTLSVGFVVDDAIVMLENIVRRMEGGEDPAHGGAQGRQGDRLHDPLDDDLARRGLHPRPLHGRAPRAALQGVRGHDQRRDPRLGLRLAHADPDALQPLPEGLARRERGALLPGDGADLHGLARPLRAHAGVDPRRARRRRSSSRASSSS